MNLNTGMKEWLLIKDCVYTTETETHENVQRFVFSFSFLGRLNSEEKNKSVLTQTNVRKPTKTETHF